jgi:ketosteroid isomerase-like protein
MPSRSLVAALTAAALSVPIAAGCGKDDEQRVRDTLASFEKATAAHDYRALCNRILARDLVQRITRVFPSCEAALRRSAFALASQPGINVEKVRVSGDRAFALVTSTAVGQAPANVTIELVKQGDSWRVASLAGAQPPSPQLTPEQQHEREEGHQPGEGEGG